MEIQELETFAPYDASALMPNAVEETSPNDRCLLRIPRQAVGSLPPMQRALEHAIANGVAAAIACDYDLFDGIRELIDPTGNGRTFGEPFDESPWTAAAYADLAARFALAPVYIVNETVWVAERQGLKRHQFEVILPRLLSSPARTAWWSSMALDGLTHLDEAGWFRGSKRARRSVEYERRTTPWSVLSFWVPAIGHPGHWAARTWLSRQLVPMLLLLQEGSARFDAPDDHAFFTTSCFFRSDSYLGQSGMPSLQ
jgi:hypothetical protein